MNTIDKPLHINQAYQTLHLLNKETYRNVDYIIKNSILFAWQRFEEAVQQICRKTISNHQIDKSQVWTARGLVPIFRLLLLVRLQMFESSALYLPKMYISTSNRSMASNAPITSRWSISPLLKAQTDLLPLTISSGLRPPFVQRSK